MAPNRHIGQTCVLLATLAGNLQGVRLLSPEIQIADPETGDERQISRAALFLDQDFLEDDFDDFDETPTYQDLDQNLLDENESILDQL